MEAGEEVALVEAVGVGEGAGVGGLLELVGVGQQAAEVHAHLLAAAGHQDPRAQRLPDDVERLAQGGAGAGVVELGPEEGDEPVAGAGAPGTATAR